MVEASRHAVVKAAVKAADKAELRSFVETELGGVKSCTTGVDRRAEGQIDI